MPFSWESSFPLTVCDTKLVPLFLLWFSYLVLWEVKTAGFSRGKCAVLNVRDVKGWRFTCIALCMELSHRVWFTRSRSKLQEADSEVVFFSPWQGKGRRLVKRLLSGSLMIQRRVFGEVDWLGAMSRSIEEEQLSPTAELLCWKKPYLLISAKRNC